MKRPLLLKLFILMACLMPSLSAVAAEAYACYTSSNTTLTFYYDNYRSSRTGTTYDLNSDDNSPGWYGDETSYNNDITRVVFNASFANARPTTTNMWFFEAANLTSITGLNYLNTSEVTNMSAMFQGCRSLTNLNLSSFNTANVTEMRSMFNDCSHLTSLNLSSFNTANVTDMGWMFDSCTGLTSLDLSSFNTANVREMGWMFAFCTGLTSLDLSGFNTHRVKKMSGMFAFCTGLTSLDLGNLSNFRTYNVEDMTSMFAMCSSLSSLDVCNFETQNVKSMNAMFGMCSSLTSLDLGSFNTERVSNMQNMFNGCTNLTTILASSDWNTAHVTEFENMFMDCPNLVGGRGTTYDANHVDATYAHVDYGTSNPGYLTAGIEPYVVYTPENTTMSFYYDNQRFYRPGMIYSMRDPVIDTFPGWEDVDWNVSVTQVVFDPSFADYYPGLTWGWFGNMYSLQTITGMEYLNTSHVGNMGWMFSRCYSLTSLDLSHFNTDNVYEMDGMFSDCTGLTSLDLGGFNTAKVRYMEYMFNGCSELGTIYVGSDWSTAAVTYSKNMFTDCLNLVGGMGTAYDANHVDATYAHIDGGPSNPGYLTDKATIVRGDVNGDGVVNIADVTELIDILLSGAVAPATADCDNDGAVNIADVTTLIDFLLSTPDYYIVGNDPFGGWNPAAGVKMTRNADGSYSYTATIDGSVWFVFASGLSSDWDEFHSKYRFGPTGGHDESVEANTWVNTQRQNNGMGAYKFTGTGYQYEFTFIPNAGISPATGKFMIDGAVVIPPIDTYTVAGVPTSVFGTEWDAYNTSNDMTLNSNGVYELIKNNCLLNAGSKVEWKVVGNHDWGNAWPQDNCSLNIDTTGYYNLKFTFDPNTGSCSVQKL